MKRTAVALLASVTAGGLWLGCTIWNDAEPPSEDAGAALPSSSSSSTSGAAGCERAAIDAAKPAIELGTGGDIDIVVAVSKITLGASGGKVDPDFGYDLDGVCAPSCISKVDGGAKEGNLGRDDATGYMLSQISLTQDASQYANDAFTTGDLGILVRIQFYNGQPNDDDIVFSLYRSPGTESGAPPDFGDPNEKWKVDTTDLQLGDGYTSNSNGHGFVRNGQLIVNGLMSSRIPFNGDSDILLHNVTFVATLAEDKSTGRWNVNDAIGVGRWDVLDAIQTIAHVKDPSNEKQRLCKSKLFGLARGAVCASVDLNLTDDTGKAQCNALSTAVKFEAAPAILGKKETPVREEACDGGVVTGCD